MATQSVPPTIDRQLLFEDLTDTLTDLRSGRTAATLAQLLVREDYSTDLVALVDDGGRAVFHHPAAHTLLSYPFDTSGLDESNAETLWRRFGDTATWSDAHSEGVDWVHPRYQWVLDLDAEQSSWSYERVV